MAHHGYINFLQNRILNIASSGRTPAVLEIGVDRGVTLIPLVVAAASTDLQKFLHVGVDIKIQESVRLTLHYLGPSVTVGTFLMEGNSLDVMPGLIDQNMTFDFILLDGDHNYHTVSQELKFIDKLLNPGGFIIIDDYDGKWSTRDLWYADREGYEDNAHATKPVPPGGLSGVKPAVDEWLLANPDWMLSKPIPEGEPVILSRAAETNRT